MALDFATALARLLRDGALRDRFAENPSGVTDHMQVTAEDAASLCESSYEDLECQADILLHKRFEAIKALLPSTLAKLSGQAFPEFRKYARFQWPEGEFRELLDAENFLSFLAISSPFQCSYSDRSRLRFFQNTRGLGFYWAPDLQIDGRCRAGLQILSRTRKSGVREWAVYLGF